MAHAQANGPHGDDADDVVVFVQVPLSTLVYQNFFPDARLLSTTSEYEFCFASSELGRW
jgi:hypothetical protein